MPGLREQMANDTRVRKADKQRRLEAEYNEKMEELCSEIGQIRAQGKELAQGKRDHFMDCLHNLIERKAAIEKQLLSDTGELLDAYEAMEMEIKAVLEGRADDLQEAVRMMEGTLRDDQDEDEGDMADGAARTAVGETGAGGVGGEGKGKERNDTETVSGEGKGKGRVRIVRV